MPNTIKKIIFTIFFTFLFFLRTEDIFAANPTLFLSPSSGTYYLGQSFNVDVMLNSGGNNHIETSLQLNYDHLTLEVVEITNKNLYWDYYAQDFGAEDGKLIIKGRYYEGGSTSGRFATIKFKVIGITGTTPLTIDSSSVVYAPDYSTLASLSFLGSNISLLEVQPDATINIKSNYDLWAVNDVQEIIFELDTKGNEVAGSDLVVRYDKDFFQYQSMEWMNLFPNQHGFSVDQENGRITISGTANQGNPINTKGNMVKLSFLALGQTSEPKDFGLEWTSGSTTDTNVVAYNLINTDLLASAPTAKSITVGDGATLDFTFNLLHFLGTNVNRSGSITVSEPNVLSNFSTTLTSATGSVVGHNLGTFPFGSEYTLILKVDGYLKKAFVSTINIGSNSVVFGDLKPGDINNDGVINSYDLYEIYNHWNATWMSMQDLNADGKVNSFDVGILYSYFNNTDNI